MRSRTPGMQGGLRFVTVLVLAVTAVFARDARACGMFVSAARTGGDLAAHLPFLSVEQVLLFWDKQTGTEDFVRETRFERADQAFGFVVPTPSKPEVDGVTKAPFDALRAQFPFELLPPLRGLGGGGPPGAGAAAMAPPPVVVLSQQRIGMFTAFTLATTDAGAFQKWLAQNGFAIPRESEAWIAHYVTLRFFFVAFRYERGAEHSAQMTSQTVRIRFQTPNPYYPYLEPTHAVAGDDASPRMLAGWLVTRDAMQPVVSRAGASAHGPAPAVTWERPWVNGEAYQVQPSQVKAALAPDLAALVPDGPLVTVQSFRDLKRSRAGYGDVVFAPATPVHFGPADVEARRALLPVVDPSLLWPDPPADAGDATAPASPVTPVHMSMTGCAMSPGPATRDGRAWASLALIGVLVARRSRGLACAVAAASLLLACHATSPESATSTDAADGSGGVADAAARIPLDAPTPAAPLVTRADREKNALAILAGETPPGGFGAAVDPDELGLLSDPARPSVSVTAKIVVGDAALDGALKTSRPMQARCYERGLEGDASMKGTLRVDLERPASGGARVTVQKNLGLSAPVVTCCTRAIGRTLDAMPSAHGEHAVVELTFAPSRD